MKNENQKYKTSMRECRDLLYQSNVKKRDIESLKEGHQI